MRSTSRAVFLLPLLATVACGGGNTGPSGPQTAPGAARAGDTAALETGAAMLQSTAPVEQIAMYLSGFHPSKDDPQMQMESHHYCDQVNEDFAQCVLYDGNTPEARLHGVEYIISAALYARLPVEERAYWHPHNYELLSGTLRMPGLPEAAERAALRKKVNSYGKTWHLWKTGVFEGRNDDLPLGPAHLAWSFNHDGEAKPGLVEGRDTRMDLDTARERQARAEWVGDARPQGGVLAIAGAYPKKSAIAGVEDNGDRAPFPVPTVGLREPGVTGTTGGRR